MNDLVVQTKKFPQTVNMSIRNSDFNQFIFESHFMIGKKYFIIISESHFIIGKKYFSFYLDQQTMFKI